MVNVAMEKKHMLEHLQTIDYSKFLDGYLKADWLKQGRQVWWVIGNISSEQAIAIVEDSRSQLALSPLAVEDINDVRGIALETGTSFVLEVPLTSDENDNSCTVTDYQVGVVNNDMKLKLTNQILMQYLNEPYFDDLRTKQQLGYVVFCYPVTREDVLSNEFVVQSPQRSCEYIVQATNKFLVNERNKIKDLSDEAFET